MWWFGNMAGRLARQVASGARPHPQQHHAESVIVHREPLDLDAHRDEIGRIKVAELDREQRAQIRTPAFLIGRAVGYVIGWGILAAGTLGLLMWAGHLL